jgi:nicotinate-nucleotide pyrophosphorylase (carboxylating)
MFIRSPHIDTLLDLSLAEDIGCGDWTSDATLEPGARGTAIIEARGELVLAGVPIIDRLLERYGGGAPDIAWRVGDGAALGAGEVVAELTGDLRTLLALERTILNLLQRMCGVATLTRRYVDAVAGTGARVVDTRKTLPGWRALDKYAVRCGGGVNHRAALDGGVLIKDNHIAATGSVAAAVQRARAVAPHALRIEVEVEDLAGVDAALSAGAEVLLLDNFSPDGVREAVARIAGRALVEVSGGITLETIRAYAEAGADVISSGALTHSAPAADLAMEMR